MKNDKRTQEKLRSLRAVRGLDRVKHFERGGSLVDWRGGTRTVQTDKKKKRNKRACRGRYRE